MGVAKKGLAALEIEWDEGPNATLGTADVVRELESASRRTGAIARREGDVETAVAGAATKVEATYQVPFLAHTVMEPMNCTVDLRQDSCEVW
jgi:isoquinoline 1-oxidoreductase beta subunit